MAHGLLAGFAFGACVGGAILFVIGVAVGVREEQTAELERQSRIMRRMRQAGAVDPSSRYGGEFVPGRLRREGRG